MFDYDTHQVILSNFKKIFPSCLTEAFTVNLWSLLRYFCMLHTFLVGLPDFWQWNMGDYIRRSTMPYRSLHCQPITYWQWILL